MPHCSSGTPGDWAGDAWRVGPRWEPCAQACSSASWDVRGDSGMGPRGHGIGRAAFVSPMATESPDCSLDPALASGGGAHRQGRGSLVATESRPGPYGQGLPAHRAGLQGPLWGPGTPEGSCTERPPLRSAPPPRCACKAPLSLPGHPGQRTKAMLIKGCFALFS